MTIRRAPIDLREQAIAWVVRTGDPEFDDWTAFEAWLAARPAHADAYADAAVAEADMAEALAARKSAPIARRAVAPDATRRPGWMLWSGGAIAAALLLTIGYRQLPPPPAAPTVYQTAPGERRVVALADGSRITLNGGSRISVAGAEAGSVRLERGEGLFEVRHRSGTPFRVEVGDAAIVDVGTVFDAVREPAGTRVAVSEGAIDWQAGVASVRVPAGRRLRATDGGETVAIAPVSNAAVGGWARGQMVFEGEPLRIAAADLARSLGVPVRVAPGVAERPVRASVRLDGSAATVLGRFAALLELRLHRDARGWRLAAAS